MRVWPKTPPALTEEQHQQQKDFLKLWHEILPRKYGAIEKFNHGNKIINDSMPQGFCKTLEIGAGLGEHLEYEDLSRQDYTTLEVRADFVDRIRSRFPSVKSVVGDIEAGVPEFLNQSFDRILAIHVLEHLRNLPSALTEVKRLLKPNGTFAVVIPCEGGMAYSLARRISTQRIFEKTYNSDYTPIIKNEHVSEAWEIIEELNENFNILQTQYWPLLAPITEINLVIALLCKLK